MIRNESSISDARGDELLAFISERFPPFPARTMLGLVWSGLLVRLARSVITLSAVTLAIALLASTFLAGRTDDAVVERLIALEQSQDRQQADVAKMSDLRLRLHEAGVAVDGGSKGMERAWLNLMVLLLCTVGIANAMLMSVTERFREIGTMKCLGANDHLIVKLFLIESGLLGMVGAAVGVVLGIVMAVAAGLYLFGDHTWLAFQWGVLPGVTLAGVSAGALLSVLGAIYPALVAARMRPVEALRVEE